MMSKSHPSFGHKVPNVFALEPIQMFCVCVRGGVLLNKELSLMYMPQVPYIHTYKHIVYLTSLNLMEYKSSGISPKLFI